MGIYHRVAGVGSHAARPDGVGVAVKGPRLAPRPGCIPDSPHRPVGVGDHAFLVLACREVDTGLGQTASIFLVG